MQLNTYITLGSSDIPHCEAVLYIHKVHQTQVDSVPLDFGSASYLQTLHSNTIYIVVINASLCIADAADHKNS